MSELNKINVKVKDCYKILEILKEDKFSNK